MPAKKGEDLFAGVPPPAFGPVGNPTDRYAHLPETTREWLDELRKEDLDDLQRILQAWRRWSAIFWFLKWAVISMVSAFMGTIAFGESFIKALSYFKSGH